MTRKKINRTSAEIKAIMAEEGDFLRPIVRTVIGKFLEAEMSEAIGAQKGERVEGRLGYRSGYYPRSLITRVGKTRVESSPKPQRTIFHRDFRGLSAQREGAGGRADRDGHPGSIDSEGQSDQRRALWAQFWAEYEIGPHTLPSE